MKWYTTVLLLLALQLNLIAQQEQVVAGALASWVPDPTETQYKALTHLYLCFISPVGTEGDLRSDYTDSRIEKIVSDAHRNNVKVLMSFGGGDVPVDSLLMGNEINRANLITNILDFIDKHNLDGMENDWEPSWNNNEDIKFKLNQDFKALYGGFTSDFRDSLDVRFGVGQKLFTASIMNENRLWYDNPEYMANSNHFPLGFWDDLDFINMMNYDNGVGSSHSTYSSVFGSQGSIKHWTDQGMPIEKMVVGVPLYGRSGWDPVYGSMRYYEIIEEFPDIDSSTDVVTNDLGNGEMLFGLNGVATILRKKVAVDSIGMRGMMLCFMNYDMPYDHPMSILRAISPIESVPISSFKPKRVATSSISLNQNSIHFKGTLPSSVVLISATGRKIWQGEVAQAARKVVLPNLSSGYYILQCKSIGTMLYYPIVIQ
jgi:hypothetical protein